MVKVTLNGTVIAEAANPPVVEGNYYFPPDTVKTDIFSKSDTTYVLIVDTAYNRPGQ